MITMNARSTPRRYSDEQKAEAIDFCLKENLSCAKAAQRLGLHPSILSRWLRQYRIDQGEALPVDLRKEIRELRREKDFFKLAAAHFAKDQLPQKGFG
jgi:transposase